MVDPGESVSVTLKREFGEEAMNSLQATAEEKARMEKTLSELFSSGTKVRELACVNVTPAIHTWRFVHLTAQIYTGYVDDPRNTDNAWMETVAMNFHDDTGMVT